MAPLFLVIFARGTFGGAEGPQVVVHKHKSLVRSSIVASHTGGRSWSNKNPGVSAPDRSPDVGGKHHSQAKDALQPLLSPHSQDKKALPAGRGEVHVSKFCYPTCGVLLIGIVFILYGNRGIPTVCNILVYLFANSMMKLSVKWVFVTNGFKFPLYVTSLHFAAGTLASLVVLLWRKPRFPSATHEEVLFMIFPIAFSVVACVGAGNLALVFCSAAFTEVIGSTACIVTVAVVILSGLPFNQSQMFPVCLVALGCGVSVVGEMHFSLVGLIMCFVANLARSLKVTMQQKMMTGEVKEKFDPCTLLFWTCMPASILMAACSLFSEGLEPWRRGKAAYLAGSSIFLNLSSAVLGSCVNATILNMAQLWVTKDLGAVGSQIVVQSKSLLTVLGGMALFGEPVTWLEAFGFVTVLVGVFLFSRAERAAPEQKQP